MKDSIKKTIKRILIILVAIVILPFLAFGGLLLFVPISRPDTSVRNYVLRKIPIGTSWDSAVEIISKKHWIIRQAEMEHGLRIFGTSERALFASDYEMCNSAENPDIRIVGTKAMLVLLGEYYGPWDSFVFTYMAFDENNKLVEVVIKRDVDSL